MQKKFLNVGGNSRKIDVPPIFNSWNHMLLDIDPACEPDIVCDAKELETLAVNDFDAIYCSHNLEHYYHHEVPKVLKGFKHILKADGFVYLRVPDMNAVMQKVVQDKLDIEDVLYESRMGPILVLDVLYGYGIQIERSGQDFFAHKTGFTQKSLKKILAESGFPFVFSRPVGFELQAFAFLNKPSSVLLDSLGLPQLSKTGG